MTDTGEGYGDALTRDFWAAAREERLVVQRCASCGHHQFYPRPFCLECEDGEVGWVDAAGTGRVYSLTTVHLKVTPDLEPPYIVALVELDEGPRLLTRLVDEDGSPLVDGVAIGDRVSVAWHDRGEDPPLPIFRRA
ncbi:MAG: Zn-ribbon domain-containing OB-fold protein [Gemmatimonadota bacterium]|nr:Zn-ribbon domain-containing OB-fold protein [Gemmatimonadota bacterium]